MSYKRDRHAFTLGNARIKLLVRQFATNLGLNASRAAAYSPGEYNTAVETAIRLLGKPENTDRFEAMVAVIILQATGRSARKHHFKEDLIKEVDYSIDQIVGLAMVHKEKKEILQRIKNKSAAALRGPVVGSPSRLRYDLSTVKLYSGEPTLEFFANNYAVHVWAGLHSRDIFRHDKRFYNALSVLCHRKKTTIGSFLLEVLLTW